VKIIIFLASILVVHYGPPPAILCLDLYFHVVLRCQKFFPQETLAVLYTPSGVAPVREGVAVELAQDCMKVQAN
jgi:hypothetical protein